MLPGFVGVSDRALAIQDYYVGRERVKGFKKQLVTLPDRLLSLMPGDHHGRGSTGSRQLSCLFGDVLVRFFLCPDKDIDDMPLLSNILHHRTCVRSRPLRITDQCYALLNPDDRSAFGGVSFLGLVALQLSALNLPAHFQVTFDIIRICQGKQTMEVKLRL